MNGVLRMGQEILPTAGNKQESFFLPHSNPFTIKFTTAGRILNSRNSECPEERSGLNLPEDQKCTAEISDFDKHLFAEGTHERAYQMLGAHFVKNEHGRGVRFAVWAPNAKSVSLIGEFNEWQADRHPMCPSDSGIWTLIVPEMTEHCVYKYKIESASGEWYDKADPYGFSMEQRPRTGSVVVDLDRYQWNDESWMQNRSKKQGLDKPMSVYEVHLGSWKKVADETWGMRYLTYKELADDLLPYVLEQGFTHIELMPITEYPLDISWGYQVLGFYAPTSRYGSHEDLMAFIDRCHQEGIGVILDWVPGHFPKDGAGLNYFDGTHLYSHEDPRKGEHQDWGTMIFDYGRHEVKSFLISNAMFWLEKYHIDGLRVDAVASILYLDYSREEGDWIPNQYGGRENIEAIDFLRALNEVVHKNFPGILTIAEESTSWPMVSRPTYMGGLGFSLKWNMGWMHDTLKYMSQDSIYKQYHHNEMTFGMLYAFHENFVLPLSHDEVVHGKGSMLNKMPGDEWQKFANLRAYYGFMWGYCGKKLLFMGGEFGQWQEWNCEESLQWEALKAPSHLGLQRFVKDLNHFYKSQPALYENDFEWEGFSWIEANDYGNCVFTFIRHAKATNDFIIALSNFTPVIRNDYRIGVPKKGVYKEVINSDDTKYCGSGVLNEGDLLSEETIWHGHENSLSVKLPPLSTIMLKWQSSD